MNDLKIFSGTANQALAKRITDYLGVPLGDIALGKFPDGEISCKINEDVRGRDVFLIQPTCPPVNENIMQLLDHDRQLHCGRAPSGSPPSSPTSATPGRTAKTKAACRSRPSSSPT